MRCNEDRLGERAEDEEGRDRPRIDDPVAFASVDLDQEIPAEHYKAVAEIISYVFRLKGRAMPN